MVVQNNCHNHENVAELFSVEKCVSGSLANLKLLVTERSNIHIKSHSERVVYSLTVLQI